ncbi:MAG TPA: sugar transferase [Bacteroidetes bacterium]|nr:sugar transferase [Bacteroidota bacterium]
MTASAVALIALFPLLLIVGLIVRLSSPGPALFRQVRIGRHGKPFTLLKFRTMVANDQGAEPLVTGGDDPRITGLGKWLRRTKIDELPELWNVLVGDMSLVGYRPEVPRYVDRYRPEWRRVIDTRPGVTDPVTLRFIDEEALLVGVVDRERAYIEVILPIKMELILDYLERRSFVFDFQILIKTLWIMAFKKFLRGRDERYTLIAREAIEAMEET